MNVQDAIDRAKAIAAQLAVTDSIPSYKRPAQDAIQAPDPKRKFSSFVDEMHISGQYVGLVSGKNGETLKLIERGYNVEITLKASDREGKLQISGDPHDVAQVKQVIQDIIKTGSIPMNLLSNEQSDSVSILIPGNKVGLIIGKGGETITSLQSKSGAKIILDSQERTSNDKSVTIQGSPAAIAKAKEMIKEVIGTTVAGTTEVLKIPNDKVGLVIGKGGETIKSLNQQYGIRITIEQPSGSERDITLTGPPNALEIVKNIILEKTGLLPSFNQFGSAEDDAPKEPEYTLQDYTIFYNWYQAQIGGEPMDDDVMNQDQSDDEAPPGMGIDAPPGLGMEAPPGMGLEAPPGLGMEAPPGLNF